MISLNLADVPPQREARESYTDKQVSARVQAAAGTASDALAAIEAAAGLWERAFAAGESSALRRWQLAMIGRALLLCGQSLWYVRGSRRATFEVVSSHDVRGRTGRPESWRYRLNIPAPDTTRTLEDVRPDRVAHFRIGAPVNRPWAGCSPLLNSKATRDILTRLESQLAQEAGGPVGSIIPVPAPSDELAKDIRDIGGSVVLGESGLQGYDESRRPLGKDWEPQRIGFNAPESAGIIRRDVVRIIVAACGVPPALVAPEGGGQPREYWRQFLHGTIAPVAAVVSEELARLGIESAITFDDLRASDIQGRARAFQSLTGGGMERTDAARIAGVE